VVNPAEVAGDPSLSTRETPNQAPGSIPPRDVVQTPGSDLTVVNPAEVAGDPSLSTRETPNQAPGSIPPGNVVQTPTTTPQTVTLPATQVPTTQNKVTVQPVNSSSPQSNRRRPTPGTQGFSRRGMTTRRGLGIVTGRKPIRRRALSAAARPSLSSRLMLNKQRMMQSRWMFKRPLSGSRPSRLMLNKQRMMQRRWMFKRPLSGSRPSRLMLNKQRMMQRRWYLQQKRMARTNGRII
jgi:hypothetical protein